MINKIITIGIISLLLLTSVTVLPVFGISTDLENNRVRNIIKTVSTLDNTGWDFIVDDDGGDYTSIQDAIDAAWSGCRILVKSGIYEKIVINIPELTLHGENIATTIIDGNGGTHYDIDVVQIRADGINISGFTIQNSGDGGMQVDYDAGIDVKSSYNIIIDNHIRDNSWGLFVRGSHNVISRNIVIDSYLHGIDIAWGSYQTITDNDIKNVEYCQGIDLYDTHDSFVSGNNISNCYDGMWIRASNGNTVTENTIKNCLSEGILVFGSSVDNVIYHNTFMKNGIRNVLSDDGNYWDNGVQGNYWDDYHGIDINPKDGIGDTPYLIYPYLIYGAKDNYPLMKPYGKSKNSPFVSSLQGIVKRLSMVVNNFPILELVFKPVIDGIESTMERITLLKNIDVDKIPNTILPWNKLAVKPVIIDCIESVKFIQSVEMINR